MPTSSNNSKDFYKTLTLAELRKRQRMTEEQISRAFQMKNDKALESLRIVENDLMSELLDRS